MHEALYEMIFKRKSFHLFRNLGGERLSAGDLEDIKAFWQSLTPLCPDIKTAIDILPARETTCKRGQEFCILIYSEKKEHYLQNIGYMGQLLDLYLVSRNIGSLWFGLKIPEEKKFQGLDYVIMIAISKVADPGKFRKDMAEADRKPVIFTWKGAPIDGVTDIARFAPSACNSQPWRVQREENTLQIYRYLPPGRVLAMTPDGAKYINRIDMGVYLCFLELCLKHRNIPYTLQLHPDPGTDGEMNLEATIVLNGHFIYPVPDGTPACAWTGENRLQQREFSETWRIDHHYQPSV